ncbi:phosphotransferase [Spirochaeta lutea]|uniref:Aminoglycoside phosphotransferase domain-containing protein n=1 Tax=Spirochaeta lutea TaxID=1480694 RepID=A0A098QVI6_9SPIO|nr:phosphotransferase [Spirochaeta lutea]KGE71744.1 hypothetical protein DC28_10915 [Spirochaeta lutea]
MSDFSRLTPPMVIAAVEQAYELNLDGTVTGYPSYINRVYGLRTDQGQELMVKFYRPGRWTEQALEEEVQFTLDCASLDLPVVPPLPLEQPLTHLPDSESARDRPPSDGLHSDRPPDPEDYLAVLSLDHPAEPSPQDQELEIFFSLFPKRSGRSFDTDREEDWIRIGSLVGRLHRASGIRKAEYRLTCTPGSSTRLFLDELESEQVIHPELSLDFLGLARRVCRDIEPLFQSIPLIRIHGDCHRGNILDRGPQGLLLMDFDDMMTGPAVQDLWMLLPGRLEDSRYEMELLLEGYRSWNPLAESQLSLIEPLRFMRMIYYLAWQSRQRRDRGFQENHPAWGTRSFWITELEDLREQARHI